MPHLELCPWVAKSTAPARAPVFTTEGRSPASSSIVVGISAAEISASTITTSTPEAAPAAASPPKTVAVTSFSNPRRTVQRIVSILVKAATPLQINTWQSRNSQFLC